MNNQQTYIVRNKWTDDKAGFPLLTLVDISVQERGRHMSRLLQKAAYMLGCEVWELEFVKVIEKAEEKEGDVETEEIDYALIGI